MLQRGFNLIRYADDFVVLCRSKESAEAALKFANNYLEKRLGLELKEAKTRIIDYRGSFDFLGFRIAAGVHSPSQKSISKLKQKISALSDHRSGHQLFPILVRLSNVLNGWHVAYRGSELGSIPQDVNSHVVSCICGYLSQYRLIPTGKKLKSKQIRMLGIPLLPIARPTVRRTPHPIPVSRPSRNRKWLRIPQKHDS